MLSVLYFTAKWCGPCRAFGPVVDEVKRDLNVQINKTDVDEHQDTAIQFQISSIPTLVFLKNGNEVYRYTGAMSKQQLINVIKSYE